MSVVRDILGVQSSQQSPMAAVISSFTSASKKQPSVGRKRIRFEKRELLNLRDSDTLVVSPPSSQEGSSNSWKLKKFNLSSNPYLLSHWDNRTDSEKEAYSGDRFNIQVEMPPHNSHERVFHTLRESELNFIVASDRLIDEDSTLTPERLKQIYYSVYAEAFPGRKCRFSFEAEVERKRILEERQKEGGSDKSASEIKKREKQLSGEIKELEKKLKDFETDSLFIDKLFSASHDKQDAKSLVSLASAEKKPPGYDLIYKFLPGVTGTKSESSVMMVSKTPVDFAAMTQVSEGCTSFNSIKMIEFFRQLNELQETEKGLSAFIKKREAEIKALKKQS